MGNKNRGIFSSCMNVIISLIISIILIAGGIGYGMSHGVDIGKLFGSTFSFLTNGLKSEETLNNTKSVLSSAAQTASSAIDTATNTVTSTKNYNNYKPFSFTGSKQFENGDFDSLGRATYGHIQLKYSDKPNSDRESKITYDPIGWHNYKLKYKDENGNTKETWLMNRGHLIGYLFSGLNSEGKNLVPMTRYLNAGTINSNKMDSNNPYGMLFYETALNNWLKANKNSYLDYYVVPNYTGNELLPRTVSLYWTGFDNKGNQVKVLLSNIGRATYNGLVGSVTLDNNSENAIINYADGTATGKYN